MSLDLIVMNARLKFKKQESEKLHIGHIKCLVKNITLRFMKMLHATLDMFVAKPVSNY